MNELHFPWLELCVLVPLVGAAVVSRYRNPFAARRASIVVTGIAFALTVLAWQDFRTLHTFEADDRWHVLTRLVGRELLVIDELSAPLLPMAALLNFLTTVSTLRTKVPRFGFAGALVSEAILLATLCTKEPWPLIALLGLAVVPRVWELRARGESSRVFLTHMVPFVACLVAGWFAVEREGPGGHSFWALLPLLVAVSIRAGIAPFHCWMPDLFERATFGTALLFVTPITGAYLAMRLVVPIAPDWVLRSLGVMSLVTAVYAAAMALVQVEARRFFCYLFLSHSALVLVGLEMVTPIGLTGALCVWLAAGMSLAGFGLTLRALKARRGKLFLTDFQGLYEHTPVLAVCFFLTGLGSIGFPGTLGFVGTELLVDGAVATYPYIGVAVVVAAALNGIAFVKVYFLLFTGTRYRSSVSLVMGNSERFAVLSLTALIVFGGLFPHPGVASRYHAAMQLLRERAVQLGTPLPEVPTAPHGHGAE